jgi:F0F1-type ATP synthase assembly protein I
MNEAEDIADEKLKALQDKIATLKPAEVKPISDETSKDDESFKKTMRVATDIIGTPIVCGAIGMGIDEWFSTAPFWFLIMAFLGVSAGFWNLYRAQIGADSAVGFKRLRSAEKQGKKAQFLGVEDTKDPTP